MKAIKEISLNGEKYQIFDKSAHDKIDNLEIPEVDLSEYATKEEVEAIPEIKVVTLENAPNDETDKNIYFICEDDIPEGSFFFKVICGTDTLKYKINYSSAKTANVVPFEKCYVVNNTKLTSLYEMFSGVKNLLYFNGGNLDTSNVTSMYRMFYNCQSLTSLDLSNFDTSKVTSMYEMFEGCSALQSLDLSNFDTSKIKYMERMFYNCSSLTSLDLSNFDTSNVISMERMFEDCSALQSLDLYNFDTSNVTSMNYMFYYCQSLTSLDLSNFDTSKVTSMNGMFFGCSSLTSLDLSNFDTSKVTSMNSMFGTTYIKLNNLNHIKCKQAFKDWCETNKTATGISYIWDNITWEIVDAETEE